MTPGPHVLEFDFKYDGLGAGTMAFGNYSGVGQGGTGVLKVDGKEVATEKMPHTLPFILQWDEALDIGSDTGTPVDDADYQTPFTFTGTLKKITLSIDRPKLEPRGREASTGDGARSRGRTINRGRRDVCWGCCVASHGRHARTLGR